MKNVCSAGQSWLQSLADGGGSLVDEYAEPPGQYLGLFYAKGICAAAILGRKWRRAKSTEPRWSLMTEAAYEPI